MTFYNTAATFGVSGASTGEALKAFNGLNSFGGIIGAGGGGGGTSYPKAFVNILLFDKDYNFLDIAYEQINGGEQIGASPKAAHDYMSREYTVKEVGYAFMYISNESPTNVETYFDDVVMSYTPSNIVQYNEYYPFGLSTASSWTRENNTGNNFLYNESTELNPSSGYYDLFFRNFDPVLGRFAQVDPLASSYHNQTPYQYGNNDPVYWSDPSGAGGDAKPKRVSASDEMAYRNMYGTSPGVYGMDEIWFAAGMGWTTGKASGYAITSGVYGLTAEQSAAIKGERNALNWMRKYLGIEDAEAGEMYQNGITVWAIFPNAYFEGKEGNTYEMHYDGFFKLVSAKKVKQGATPTPWFFTDGFFHPDRVGAERSNFFTMSGAAGGYGLVGSAAEYSLLLDSKIAPGNFYKSAGTVRASLTQGSKFMGQVAGPALGGLGVLAASYESAVDSNGYTLGDGVKTGVGILMVGLAFTPLAPLAAIYAVADIYVGVTTGYSITDRIGIGVDYSSKH